MILYDFSSSIHRNLHTAIKNTNPHKKNGKYITNEFIDILIFRICDEIMDFYKQYTNEYKDFIITLDNHTKPYWRKEIYPFYKQNRKKERETSEVNYDEVFYHIDNFCKILNDFTNFKVIGIPGVEADDIIGLLTRKYGSFEKILILSPDKDFKQLHNLGDIKQYSSITKSFIEPGDLNEWKQEHICLGDTIDNVPRIVDFLEFTPDFKKYLESLNIFENELQFFDNPKKYQIMESYDSDKFVKMRFGKTGLKKAIEAFGGLDNYLDSNPILRKTYELNKKLVLDIEIPANIEAQIIAEFSKEKKSIDLKSLKRYFDFYNLNTCYQMFSELSLKTSKVTDWKSYNVDFNTLI